MDGLWLSDKILRLIRDKKEQTTQFVMQGSTTERKDYNYMIGKFRVLEEIEDEIKENRPCDEIIAHQVIHFSFQYQISLNLHYLIN